jgi:hypothetical protein
MESFGSKAKIGKLYKTYAFEKPEQYQLEYVGIKESLPSNWLAHHARSRSKKRVSSLV